MSDISKLPKWAQEHITTLKHQRDTAVDALEAWSNKQTPAPFSITEMICTTTPPTIMTRYIQSRRMTVTHAGMQLEVLLSNDTIEISYSPEDRVTGDVMLQPRSYQHLRLRAIPQDAKS